MSKLGFGMVVAASLAAGSALAESPSPEVDACKASGLIALQQRNPQVKDVEVDLDSTPKSSRPRPRSKIPRAPPLTLQPEE
jgi:hypothetical protein